MKKQYILPGLWEKKEILIPLLSLYKNNPFLFYDDINFNAVFGNFSYFLWDGGRLTAGHKKQLAYLEDILIIQHIYNDILNISMRFVCTNPFIQSEDFTDKFCNLVLDTCENNQNGIIINNDLLEEYLRKKYPLYYFISSTTKCLENNNEIITELKKPYKYVCLSYTKNYDILFLNSLSSDLKNKIELLINDKCYGKCPKRKGHYIAMSKSNYYYDSIYGDNYDCILINNPEKAIYTNRISYDQLNNYTKIGINYFKLEGRQQPYDSVFITDLVQYCFKPEWQLMAIKNLENWKLNFNLYNYQLKNYSFI